MYIPSPLPPPPNTTTITHTLYYYVVQAGIVQYLYVVTFHLTVKMIVWNDVKLDRYILGLCTVSQN